MRLLWLAALCLLAACSGEGQQAELDNYLQRLARTLEQPLPEQGPAAIPVHPRSAALRLPIAGSKLDTLDFLALSGCAVQATIGKRNTSLGRFARPSQQLLLDLEYLRLAPACIEQRRSDGEVALADLLQEAWDLKQQQLPQLVFNATLGSDEYRQFWRPNPASEAGTQVITALEAIDSQAAGWLAGDFTADGREFELFLGDIRSGDGGELMAGFARQASVLDSANTLLSAQQQQGPLCTGNLRPRQVDVLETVIRQYFAGQVQPRSAALARRYHQLLPPIQSLEARLRPVLPETYLEWMALRGENLAIWDSAPKRHVTSLQASLAPCGGLRAAP